MTDRVIDVRRVSKRFAEGRGICEVDLTVSRGESVALWGPNGAGKTTLLRAILGETSFNGSIHVFGRIGYAPQYLPDFEMPVRDLVTMIAALRGVDPKLAQRTVCATGFDAYEARTIEQLSGGLRQRLGLALALLGDPPILLLDEPTAGLDRTSRCHVIAMLEKLHNEGKTILFTSHILEDVVHLAQRVVVIEGGRIVEDVAAQHFERRAS